MLSLRLVCPDGHPLPSWEPGAHIDLVLPSGRGRGGSVEVHTGIRAAQLITVYGPRNHFLLLPSSAYLFIAGGIRITAILPMAGRVAAMGKQWRLVYTGWSRRSMAFITEVTGAAQRPLEAAYGVVAALEALQILAEQGAMSRFEPVVVVFVNAGGRALSLPLLGIADAHRPDRPRGAERGHNLRPFVTRAVAGHGRRLRQHHRGELAARFDRRLPGARHRTGIGSRWSGAQIGVVETIAGRTVFDIEVRGRAGHPRAVPMEARVDALTAAARMVICRTGQLGCVGSFPG